MSPSSKTLPTNTQASSTTQASPEEAEQFVGDWLSAAARPGTSHSWLLSILKAGEARGVNVAELWEKVREAKSQRGLPVELPDLETLRANPDGVLEGLGKARGLEALGASL